MSAVSSSSLEMASFLSRDYVQLKRGSGMAYLFLSIRLWRLSVDSGLIKAIPCMYFEGFWLKKSYFGLIFEYEISEL